MHTNTFTRSGRHWAYIAAILGGLVSIAANVAHSYVPPTELTPELAQEWSPNAGAVVSAIVWPVFLFIAVEILARVAWPHGLGWQLLRWVGITPVAAVAALVSYRHLSGLLAFYGEEPIVALLGPLAVDGLMVMATGALLATSQPTNSTTTTAQTTENTTESTTSSTTSHGLPTPAATEPTPVLTALTPSAATPSTSTTTTPPAGDTAPQHSTTPATTAAPAARPADVPTPAKIAARINPDPARIPLRPTAERPATARDATPRPRMTEPTTTAQKLAAPATNTPVTEPEPAQQLPLPYTVDPALLVKVRDTARQYRTEHGTPITAGPLAARLRVNSELATHVLAVLALEPDNPTTEIKTVNGKPVKAAR